MWQRVLAVHRIPENKLRMVTGAADPDRFRPPEDPVAIRAQLKLPLRRVLLSSLPAQAASTIGSSRITARFADIPKSHSFFVAGPRA